METNLTPESPASAGDDFLSTQAGGPINIPQEEPEVITPESPGMLEAAYAGFTERHVLTSLYNRKRLHELSGWDENFVLDRERIDRDLENRGLADAPIEDRLWLAEAENERQYNFMMFRVSERQADRERMAELGGASRIAAELIGYASDPVGFAIDVAVGGAAKGRMLKRFFDGGSRAVFAESIIEAGLASDGEPVDLGGVAMGMGAAFLMGGTMGAVFGRIHEDAEVDAAMRRFLRNEATLDDEKLLTEYGMRSAGAAQADTAIPVIPGQTGDNLSDFVEGLTDFKFSGWDTTRARVSTSAAGNRIKRPDARKLSQNMFGAPLRRAAETGENPLGWSEKARSLFQGWQRRIHREHRESFLDWYKDVHEGGRGGSGVLSNFKRKVKAGFALELDDQFSNEVGLWFKRKGQGDFHPAVVRAGKAYQGYFKEIKDRMIREGYADPEDFIDDDFWLPRIASRRKIGAFLANTRGRTATIDGKQIIGEKALLEEMIYQSIKNGRLKAGLDFDETITRAVAKAYRNRLTKANLGEGFRKSDLDGVNLDMDDLDEVQEVLRELDPEDLADSGINKLDELIEAIKNRDRQLAKDADTPDRMQRRLTMDYDTVLELDDGTQFRVDDIFETNVSELGFNYGRWAGGELTLHKAGTSSRELRRQLDKLKADNDFVKNDPTQSHMALSDDEINILEFGYRAVMGLRTFNNEERTVRAVSALKSLSYATRMNAAFLNAISESYRAVAEVGFNRAIKSIPAIKQIADQMIRGKAPDKWIRQLLMLDSGLSDSYMRGMASIKYDIDITGHASSRGLQRLETFAEGAKRATSMVNLLGQTTDFTRRATAVMLWDDLDDYLTRGARKPKWWHRRAEYALSDERVELLRDYLNSDAVVRGKKGELLDFGEMPIEVQNAIEEFEFRGVGRIIQDIDRGDLPRFMQENVWASMILQFRSFEVAAHERHLMTDMFYRDAIALQAFVGTSALAGLNFAARAYVFSPFNEEKREEMLTWQNIVTTGTSYAVNLGLVKTAEQMLSSVVNDGDPFIWDAYRTSGLEAGLAGTPVYQMFMQGMKAAEYPFRFAREAVFDQEIVPPDQEEAKAALAVTGLSNFWFTRWLADWAVEQLPEEERDQPTFDLIPDEDD